MQPSAGHLEQSACGAQGKLTYRQAAESCCTSSDDPSPATASAWDGSSSEVPCTPPTSTAPCGPRLPFQSVMNTGRDSALCGFRTAPAPTSLHYKARQDVHRQGARPSATCERPALPASRRLSISAAMASPPSLPRTQPQLPRPHMAYKPTGPLAGDVTAPSLSVAAHAKKVLHAPGTASCRRIASKALAPESVSSKGSIARSSTSDSLADSSTSESSSGVFGDCQTEESVADRCAMLCALLTFQILAHAFAPHGCGSMTRFSAASSRVCSLKHPVCAAMHPAQCQVHHK